MPWMEISLAVGWPERFYPRVCSTGRSVDVKAKRGNPVTVKLAGDLQAQEYFKASLPYKPARFILWYMRQCQFFP